MIFMTVNLEKNENAEERSAKIDCEATVEAYSGDFLQLYSGTFAIIQSTYSRNPIKQQTLVLNAHFIVSL